jgi:hypothetical protein
MRSRFRIGYVAILLCGLAAAAEPPAARTTMASKAAPAADSAPARCVVHCEKAEASCSSQVRRARQDCSKKAANNGRDPMLMRRDYSAYFCGYFGSTEHCARNPFNQECRSRFGRRHGLCVDAIQDNIAAQRYDCYLNERDAQTFCRDELRDCRESCGS